jgi:GR25 family glycosyltransferase involved in LPS biosynthesis
MEVSDLLKIKAYVINMPDKEENYQICENELKKHNFKNINRFISYNSQDELLLENISKSFGLYKFSGTNSQQSLALAHLTILNNLINSDDEEVLIFEDDIIFHDKFDELLEVKIKNITDYDLLFLGSYVIGNKLTDVDFVIKKDAILHAHAYVITKKSAKLIFEECAKKNYTAIDQVYSSVMRSKLNQVAIINSPYSSMNHSSFRLKEQEFTGLIFQKKHISTVLNSQKERKEKFYLD